MDAAQPIPDAAFRYTRRFRKVPDRQTLPIHPHSQMRIPVHNVALPFKLPLNKFGGMLGDKVENFYWRE